MFRQHLPQSYGRIYYEINCFRTQFVRQILYCIRSHQHGRNLERSGESGLSSGETGAGEAWDSCEGKRAVQITKADYGKYDYILGMEERNIRNILRIVGKDPEHKVKLLLDYSDHPRDIADPWYTGNFESTYRDVVEGCEGFLLYLEREGRI